MSYLNNTRLVFNGTFQADVSTVNNDVRHFNNTLFQQRFQDMEDPNDGTENGWWNPVGSGAFRLIGCRVKTVHYKDGSSASDPAKDPAVGLLIGGSNERVAAKLVDLDPQWQMASQIWGLDVRLSAGQDPPLAHGKFLPSAFRDLVSPRIHGKQGDSGRSSNFQSILESVTWSAAADGSKVLRELKDAAAGNALSMRIMTYGYVMDYDDQRFSLGSVCGVIGPYLADEPKTFVRGRRFTPDSGGQSWNGINYFTAAIDEASSTLLLDLGNALQFADATGAMRDIGKLTVGILTDPSLAERAAVTAANFETLGEIDYRAKNWLFETSGVHAVPLNAAQMQRALAAPLALAADQAPGGNLVAIRENANGLLVCAEEFVQRIDTPGKGEVVIHAAQFGKPLAGAEIAIGRIPKTPGIGGGDPRAPNPPKAAIPDICFPPEALSIADSVTSDNHGLAKVEIVLQPLNSPRRYMDGQIYLFQYGMNDESANAHPNFDLIAVHARDSFPVPAKPSWIPDIAPIFTQFGNLYPIMSQRLVDLSDPEAVKRNLKILQLVFSLDVSDPNYMPVTRDLSANKRTAIQRWLQRLATEGDPTFVGGPRTPSAIVASTEAVAVRTEKGEQLGGKTIFERSLPRNFRKSN